MKHEQIKKNLLFYGVLFGSIPLRLRAKIGNCYTCFTERRKTKTEKVVAGVAVLADGNIESRANVSYSVVW